MYPKSQVAADGGWERDVVHRMSEGYRVWGALKSIQNLSNAHESSFASFQNIYEFREHYLAGIFAAFCRFRSCCENRQIRQRASYSCRRTNQRSFDKASVYILYFLHS